MVEVDPAAITEYLLQRAQWSASRSSGPGGQRRDKVSTRAELVLDAASVLGLEPEVAVQLTRGLGLDHKPLRIVIQDDRMLGRNREAAALRLSELVTAALAPPPPARRPTRPSRKQRQVRLANKDRRAQVKRQRQPPDDNG